MSVIGEAFVRVRPETSGFEQEAEPGIKSAFTHLAKIAAAAFAVEQSFSFGKEIIQGAADVQKQVEGVRETFGGFADDLLHFNESLAGSFGVSERVADSASATFGRLFKSLGIGVSPAEQMTKGFEQLAGALSSIRGVDPREIFAAIPQALAGNVRILRQFGIITDAASIKIAAFKLGLTDSISQALTPAQRATAVYAIATAQLPTLLEQARRHSHDLADQLSVLRATIDNAKDALGARLVPAANTVIALLIRGFPPAIAVVRRGIADIRADISDLADFVRPALQPFIREFDRVRDAFQEGGIGGAIDKLKADLVSIRPAAVVAAAAIGAVGAAFAISFVAEAPLTALVLAVTGLGIAFREVNADRFRGLIEGVGKSLENVAPRVDNLAHSILDGLGSALDYVRKHLTVFEVIGAAVAGAAAGFAILTAATAAYQAVVRTATAVQILFDAALDANPVGLIVIAIGALVGALVVLYFHSDRVRKIVNGAFDGLKRGAEAVLPTLKEIAGDIGAVAHALVEDFAGTIRTVVAVVEGIWRRFGSNITSILKGHLEGLIGVVRGALRVIKGVFEVITGLITGDWGKAWKGLEDIVGGAFDVIRAQAKTFSNDLHQIFDAMWKGIAELFLRGVEKIVGLLAAIPSVHAKIPGIGTVGFTNPFKGADKDLKDAIDGLAHNSKDAVDAIGDTTAGAARAAAGKAADGIAEAQRSVRDAAAKAAQQGPAHAEGLAVEQAANAAAAAGDAIDSALSTLNGKLNRTVSVSDAQIAKLRSKITDLGTQIADALKQETKDVQDAVAQAEQNLNSIGQTLSQTIGQVIDKPLQDLQNSLSRQGNKDALEQLRQSVLLPGGKQLSQDPTKALAQLRSIANQAGNVNKLAIQDFIRQYQGAVLSVKQDQANVIKEGATRRISDLTDAFNNGKITLAQFKKGILAELTRDRVGYRQAGALLGTAFENGFKAQVKGLFDQAAAITATPADRRAGVNALAPSIIRPLETLRESEKGIAKLTHQKMDAQTALQRRIAKASEAQAALLAKIASVRVNPNTPTAKNPGRTQDTSTTYNKTTG